MRTVSRLAASASGTRSSSAARTASSYWVYLVVSRSNVSYVCSSRLSCSGCSGACPQPPQYGSCSALGLHVSRQTFRSARKYATGEATYFRCIAPQRYTWATNQHTVGRVKLARGPSMHMAGEQHCL